MSGSAVASEQKETQNAKKVILDTDMVEMFDDGVAMLMLMENPKIDLLGVVTVTGNTWANDGMAYMVRQLKAINKLDSAPTLAIGSQYPKKLSQN
ncbi:MAG: nucleoside hydrolase [Succinivibrionaceae bacterium]|nr:nucleoside hydrolase [Succinivibrionaceae bacterium]